MIELPRRLPRCQVPTRRCFLQGATTAKIRSLTSPTHDSSPSVSALSTHNLQQPSQAYVSTSSDPFENLAIEHYLLSKTPASSKILFFYLNRPCIVIGRNQNPWVECNLKALRGGLHQEEDRPNTVSRRPSYQEILFVRRRSGGGTVFHDEGNLNYSIIVPNDKSFTRRKYPELVVKSLKQTQWAKADVSVNDRNDIVLRDGHQGSQPLKISGSAYKLTRGRALAHGTLLFASPNLSRISALLRSPGKPYLHARGVESVRSPVGNLITTEKASQDLKSYAESLMNAIFRTWGMEESAEETDPKSAFLTPVGGRDCQPEVNTELASGVEELRSDAWRFEQTPRFDVDLGSIDDVTLKIQVNRGQIDNVETTVGQNVAVTNAEMKHQLEGALIGLKVHETQDWDQLLSGTQLPQQAIERLSSIFPVVTTGISAKVDTPLEDGPKEVEEYATNTVREVS